MSFLEYDLNKLMYNRERVKALNSSDLLEIMYEIAVGVEEVLARDALHRDLKPDNVLVHNEDGKWCVQLIDFGLARKEYSNSGIMTQFTGQGFYQSPEIVVGARNYTKSTDVFSLGFIFAIFMSFWLSEEMNNHLMEPFTIFPSEKPGILEDTVRSQRIRELCLIKGPIQDEWMQAFILRSLKGVANRDAEIEAMKDLFTQKFDGTPGVSGLLADVPEELKDVVEIAERMTSIDYRARPKMNEVLELLAKLKSPR
eukprot:138888_1